VGGLAIVTLTMIQAQRRRMRVLDLASAVAGELIASADIVFINNLYFDQTRRGINTVAGALFAALTKNLGKGRKPWAVAVTTAPIAPIRPRNGDRLVQVKHCRWSNSAVSWLLAQQADVDTCYALAFDAYITQAFD
jgi:hypothetical protein